MQRPYRPRAIPARVRAAALRMTPARLHRLNRIHDHLPRDGSQLRLRDAQVRKQADVATVPRLCERPIVEERTQTGSDRPCKLRPPRREALLQREQPARRPRLDVFAAGQPGERQDPPEVLGVALHRPAADGRAHDVVPQLPV